MPGDTVQDAPTPLSRLAGQLTSSDLLPARLAAGAREAHLATERAARTRESLGSLRELTAGQARERAEARPEPPTLTPPPSTAARPFLSPGEGVLAQLQTAILGATQLALGVGGLQGRGHAIAAVAGLKGAMEGWQAGDRDRVDRALAEWHASSKALLDTHRLRREAYTDLLTDQTRTVDQVLSEIEITARIDGDEQLAAAAHTRNLDAVIGHLSQQEMKAATLGLGTKRLDAEIAHWKQQAAKADRDFAATQAHRRETEARGRESSARGERRTRLAEETSGGLLKLQAAETGLTQKIENADVVRDAVDLLDQEDILPKGATVWDAAKAQLALQSKPGRPDIAQAVQVVNRLGTSLVVGTEVGLGTTGSALRLKVIGEAEAGNMLGAPKQFWDLFIPAAKKKWESDRAIARQHLQQLGRLPQGLAGYEIVGPEK